ncbi:MAG: transaldolase [Nitrospirae bacterium]|nr:transaldolase [Nitrospirota bacterium]
MKPKNLRTRIFLDGGDPDETRQILQNMGFIDGQTTNPTLIAKNPIARQRMEKGEKFKKVEILEFYRSVVKELSNLIPHGSISVEVYADHTTTAEEMIGQAEEMFSWIPNAHIKLPIIPEGLKAAEIAVKKGIRINMTLCFTQEQAAAVYVATLGARKGDVFVSPFVGRLDDRGENGMDLISNIIKMYENGDGHVEVLTASVRNYEHLLCSLKLASDIVTVPFKVLIEWNGKGLQVPDNEYIYKVENLKKIDYKKIDLGKKWQHYEIRHELTDIGLKRFVDDWISLIQ